MDDMIYADFRESFPDFPVDKVDEELLKSKEAKELWRPWIMKYEKSVNEYNFGTLLRQDHTGDYTQDNTLFGKWNVVVKSDGVVTRMQFYAIELARNREGLNRSIQLA